MRQPAHKEPVSRLLVRGPNWIGDAVMSEPALTGIRRLYPEADITLLVKPAVAELFHAHPAVNRIMVYESTGRHAGLSGKWTLAETIRRGRFEMAILFQNAFEAAFLTCLAGVPRRYGYATDGRSLFLTQAIPPPRGSAKVHQVQYYVDLLRPLGAFGEISSPRLFLSDEDEHRMRQRLKEAEIGEQDFLVGLNPGATYGSAKRWLPERFAETANRLVEEISSTAGRPARVVIVGARGEEAIDEAIASRIQGCAVRLTGQTTVRELMAVIKRCDLFLTNDTGPMHIAAAFAVPVVAVFGPTDARTTSPVGGRASIMQHPVECSPCLLRHCPIDHRCMTAVTVEQVYEAAVKLLAAGQSESQKCEGQKSERLDVKTFGREDMSLPLKNIPVFLDRDGTLNRDTGYVKAADELEMLPGTEKAVARLNQAGARAILITNQSGIGRGFFSHEDLAQVHERLRERLAAAGGTLDAIYYCPHHPDEGCACRKPKTGMVDRAAQDLGLSPATGYLIGDQSRDIELAHTIGARSVLIMSEPSSGEARDTLRSKGIEPHFIAASLTDAVDWIMTDVRTRDAINVLRER